MTAHPRLRSTLLFLIAVLLSGKSAFAADDVLTMVPDDAWGFAVVKNLGETDGKISKLATQLSLPVPGSPLAMLKMTAGFKQGLNEKGTAMVVFVGDEPPTPIVLLPVTDYKAFIGQLNPDDASAKIARVTISGNPTLVAKKGDYAVLSDPKAEDALTKFLAGSSSAAKSFPSLTAWTANLDAYGVITRRSIERGLGAARQGIGEAKRSFENLGDEGQRQQMQMVAQIFDVYDRMFATLEQELTHFAVGLRLGDADGLHVVSQTAVREGGALAKALADVEPFEGKPFQGLPAEPFLFAFHGEYPQAILESMMEMSVQMMVGMMGGTKELDEQQRKKLTESMTELTKSTRSMAMVMGVLEPGKSIYSNMVGIIHVDDAPKYLANSEAMMRQMSEMMKDAKGPIKPYEIGQETVAGVKTMTMTMDMSAMMQAPPDENARRMFEMMFGPGGKLMAYMAAADKQTIIFAYDKDAFSETWKLHKSGAAGLASDPQLAETAKLLPKGAQWLGYWSPQGTVDFAGKMMAANPAMAGFKLPEFPKTPPVGFAAQAQKQTLTTDLVIPPAVVKAIGTYVQQVQQQFGGGPQNEL